MTVFMLLACTTSTQTSFQPAGNSKKGLTAITAGEDVVPFLSWLPPPQIREFEGLPGKKTMENEIPKKPWSMVEQNGLRMRPLLPGTTIKRCEPGS